MEPSSVLCNVSLLSNLLPTENPGVRSGVWTVCNLYQQEQLVIVQDLRSVSDGDVIEKQITSFIETCIGRKLNIGDWNNLSNLTSDITMEAAQLQSYHKAF